MKPDPRHALAVALTAVFVILSLMTPSVWRLREGPIEVTRWPKSGAHTYLVGPHSEHWVSIERVSRHVLHAIVVAEDARYYQHSGIDLREVMASIKLNLREGRYARGASTISQQVVKMSFLSPEKSILRKMREAIGAVLLECLLDKDEILEWYINLAEFGDGVFGIKDAANHYFQTSPELLTIQQGANLALVLPSPNGWSVGLRARSLTDFGHQRYAHIIEQMYKEGFITDTLRKTAMATGNFGEPIRQDVQDSIPEDEPIQ